MWTTVNYFLHRKSSPVLPSYHCLKSLSQSFATFFSDKIHKLHTNLLLKANYCSPHIDPPSNPVNLSNFQPVTLDEISKLLSQSPATDSDLDPIPTSLLKQCACVLLPTITNIINLSLSSGTFPDQFKSCSVHPLLKKPNLDKEILGNYRPASHLSFLSKLIERIVKNRHMDHLSSYKLLNSFQSAYLKSHSTETALLSVHDHIIRAMSLQQITCLCLLDLSAAFDTIDHSILIHRLTSWFGINGSVLSWLKSYLSNRSFYVNLTGTKSSIFQLLYGVPQGSVLGPLLFILYTTPLSHIISKSASNHHLYADDTQLYMSFSPNYFSSNITHLEGTISISSINDGCMLIVSHLTLIRLNFSSYVILNSFLNLIILHYHFLTMSHFLQLNLLVILVSYLILIFLSLITYLLFLNLVYIISVISNVSEVLLISLLHVRIIAMHCPYSFYA